MMKKKILSAILCATTLFSAVGFSACEVTDVLFADYKQQIAEMQETLNAQQEKIADFESDVAELQEAINEKEEQIAQLEQDKQALEGQVEDLESELEKHSGIISEQEVSDMVELDTWHFTSGVINNKITLHTAVENAVFECTVDKGRFGYYAESPKQLIVSSNEIITWQARDEDVDYAFVEIVLTLEDNCLGYAVVKITNWNTVEYTASVLKSVMFPKLWGEYQKVSKEEVQALIDKVKNDAAEEENDDKADGVLHGGDLSSMPKSSVMFAYKMQEVASASDEYITLEIAISDVRFAWWDYGDIEGLDCVTITVDNMAKSEKITLDTIEAKEFTANKYRYSEIKDENGKREIVYPNYVKYNVPTSLLSIGKGKIGVTVAEIFSQSKEVKTRLLIRYEFKDGKIYFSVE